MPQAVLPFKLEEDASDSRITSFAGTPLFHFLRFMLRRDGR